MEQNQNQVNKCTGDCLKCSPIQRQYCSSQMTFNTMRMLEGIQTSVASMQVTINELKTKLEAIQGNEASLFDPSDSVSLLEEDDEGILVDISQEGDGEEE